MTDNHSSSILKEGIISNNLLKPIWNGTGNADDAVWFTKDNGEIVGRPYLRDRAAKYLSRWSRSYSLATRKSAITATIDNDAWLRPLACQTASSVCRSVEDYMLSM